MAGLPYMPLYPNDFMASTRGWSVTARGGYLELLLVQWERGSLPVSPKDCKELIGASDSEWTKIWRKCEEKFPIFESKRVNRRLEDHRSRANQVIESRREGARLTNAKRYGERVAERSHLIQSNTKTNTNTNLNPKSAERAPPNGREGGALAREPWPRPESTTPEARAAAELAMKNLRAMIRPKGMDTGEDIETKRRRVDAELAARMAKAPQ